MNKMTNSPNDFKLAVNINAIARLLYVLSGTVHLFCTSVHSLQD